GYARSSNKTGIAMGTSGPGATNMITRIASAYFDSVPVVYIAGQVNTNEITSKKDIRQTGFQEADIVSMVSKITKFSYQITKPEEIRYIFEKAFFIANHGRKGPVVLDIPMNIQRQDINHKKMKSFFKSDEYKKIIDQDLSRKKKIQEDIKKAIKLLKNSSRPVILIGGGVKYSGIKKELDAFIKKNNIPIVSSLMGLDGIDHTIKNYLGMIGSYGNREANITIMNSDLLLVLGSRLDIRQTGANKDKFCPNAKIIHIDIDQNELGYNIPSTYLKIYQELSSFFSVLEKKTYTKAKISERKNRLNKLIQLKSLLQQNTEKRAGKEYNMNYFFDKISNILPAKTIITNDVGQNQIRASQSLQIAKQQ
ncbi:MAG TPA: thiamine pyrophosphate-binding protein, partial [Candidatus Absconditabacterales bacterium]|nr:thiamine pyrophosphate-binding protein [Candidatus Absconditabacterales bacterium]